MTRRRRSIPDTRSACVCVRACVCVGAWVRVGACKGVELACASARVGRCVRVWHCPCADVTLRGAREWRTCVWPPRAACISAVQLQQTRTALPRFVHPLRRMRSARMLHAGGRIYAPCTWLGRGHRLHAARCLLHGVRLHGVRLLHGACSSVEQYTRARSASPRRLGAAPARRRPAHGRPAARQPCERHTLMQRATAPARAHRVHPEGSQPTPDRRPNPSA